MHISPLQKWLIVMLRKSLLLSLDDLLAIVNQYILPLSRSSLDRFLKDNCVNNVKTLHPKTTPPTSKMEFNSPLPGLIRIEIITLPLMPAETNHKYLLVAYDFASHWVYLKVFDQKTSKQTSVFLKELIKQAPFNIRTILTNEDEVFSYRSATGNETEPSGNHEFDQVCIKNNIEHRIIRHEIMPEEDTKELFENITTQLTQQSCCWHEWEPMLSRYVPIYNQCTPLTSLGQLTPLNKLKSIFIKSPECFHTEPKNRLATDRYLFADLMFDLCGILSLYDDEAILQGENIGKVRKTRKTNYIKNRRAWSSHRAFFSIHGKKIFFALSDKSDVNVKAREFRFSIFERIWHQLLSMPIFTFNSRQEIIAAYLKKILTPIMAIEVFTDDSIKNEHSIYYHIHAFASSKFKISARSNDFKIFQSSKDYLNDIVAHLPLKSSKVAKKITDIMTLFVDGISKDERISIFKIKIAVSDCFKYNKEDKFIKGNEIQIKKFESACLAILLILEFERRCHLGKSFIVYYQDLINDDVSTRKLFRLLTEILSKQNSTFDLNLARDIEPIVETLYNSAAEELIVLPDQFPIDDIFSLRDFMYLCMSETSPNILLKDNFFSSIENYFLTCEWSHRVFIKPYIVLLEMFDKIQTNNLENAFQLASDFPYHEDDMFGFISVPISSFCIALAIKLHPEKISYRGFSSHMKNIDLYMGTNAIRRDYATDIMLDNPMLISSPNQTLMKVISFFNTMVDFIVGNNPDNISQVPQRLNNVLDKVERVLGRFFAKLAEYGKDSSSLYETDRGNLKKFMSTEDFSGNLIGFLEHSTLKNFILDYRTLYVYLDNSWIKNRTPNIFALMEYDKHNKIELLYDILPSERSKPNDNG